MRRTLRRGLIVVVIVVAGVAAVAWILRPRPVSVSIHLVERGTVEATVANTRAGTVKACRRSRLAPTTGGQVASLPVEEGDRVTEGALLLELWNADLRAQLELAESEHLSAKASATQACLRARLAAREAERQQRLRKDGVASEEEVDRAVTDAEAQAAACEAVEAAARVAEARVAVARALLERTRVTAPFAGIVAQVDAELGEYVTPSPPGVPMPAAIDLIDETCLYVEAPIDEVDAPLVEVGMRARVTFDAFKGRPLDGKVRRVAAWVLDREKQARTVDVDVELLAPPEGFRLLPGYSADVEIVLDRREAVLHIPTESLVDGDRVLVLENGVLVEKTIEVGVSNWQRSEVVAGLSEGDRVVTSLEREGVVAGAAAVAEPHAPEGADGASGTR